jgi:hypothetical protein
MTDEQKALITAFAANEPMFEAVRAVLLTGMIGSDFSKTNWVWNIDDKLPDDQYGNQVRVTKKALEWINSGFNELKRVGQSNPQPGLINEAR